MTITTEQLDAIERGLEGVTKWPWNTHLVDDTTIISPDGTVVATTCDSAETEREDGYNIEYERMERDAAFIASIRNAAPELIRLARLGLEAERGWQPIETAPRDGTWIDLVANGRVIAGYWDAEFEFRWNEEKEESVPIGAWTDDAVASWGYEERCRYDSPTHWRPRPTPPAGGE